MPLPAQGLTRDDEAGSSARQMCGIARRRGRALSLRLRVGGVPGQQHMHRRTLHPDARHDGRSSSAALSSEHRGHATVTGVRFIQVLEREQRRWRKLHLAALRGVASIARGQPGEVRRFPSVDAGPLPLRHRQRKESRVETPGFVGGCDPVRSVHELSDVEQQPGRGKQIREAARRARHAFALGVQRAQVPWRNRASVATTDEQ